MRMREHLRRYFSGKSENFIKELREARQRLLAASGEEFTRFMGEQQDGPVFQAPARLAVDKSFFTEERALRQYEYADWQNCDPRIMEFGARLVLECRNKWNIPMFVHTAFRTRVEQERAFARGVSRVKWPRAPHCQGKAVDVVHGRYAWNLTRQEWNLIGKIGKEIARKRQIDVVWGGDWSNPWDPAHWELADWRNDVRVDLPSNSPVRLTPTKIVAETRFR